MKRIIYYISFILMLLISSCTTSYRMLNETCDCNNRFFTPYYSYGFNNNLLWNQWRFGLYNPYLNWGWNRPQFIQPIIVRPLPNINSVNRSTGRITRTNIRRTAEYDDIYAPINQRRSIQSGTTTLQGNRNTTSSRINTTTTRSSQINRQTRSSQTNRQTRSSQTNSSRTVGRGGRGGK